MDGVVRTQQRYSSGGAGSGGYWEKLWKVADILKNSPWRLTGVDGAWGMGFGGVTVREQRRHRGGASVRSMV